MLLFISIYIHVVLRNNFECESQFETCTYNFLSVHLLRARLSVWTKIWTKPLWVVQVHLCPTRLLRSD